ncbi:hypothetical protein BJV82DRAFT_588510 [Fennellomyces sp. T-0311]|nr:hypothetical protein BJV82DRAFT_588510 [Fennellomyces sp. T-0311]
MLFACAPLAVATTVPIMLTVIAVVLFAALAGCLAWRWFRPPPPAAPMIEVDPFSQEDELVSQLATLTIDRSTVRGPVVMRAIHPVFCVPMPLARRRELRALVASRVRALRERLALLQRAAQRAALRQYVMAPPRPQPQQQNAMYFEPGPSHRAAPAVPQEGAVSSALQLQQQLALATIASVPAPEVVPARNAEVPNSVYASSSSGDAVVP